MKEQRSHIMPFLWVHGEGEETYRRMVQAISDSGLRAFCVEARPHPEFVREGWWKDMKILLDEASRRNMQVWILDDKHFPTGYAAGAVEKAPLALKKQCLAHRSIPLREGERIRLDERKLKKYKDPFKARFWNCAIRIYNGGKKRKRIGADELLSCTAYSQNRRIDLTACIANGMDWVVPEGDWTLEVCILTYDAGTRGDYINMLDPDSCRLLIDAVYEPHYRHFKEMFGTVIAGFFSDEPELGNGCYACWENVLGTEQTLPYSSLLAQRLEQALGNEWRNLLPLLWKNDFDGEETARVRYLYMDQVSHLVKECFSLQIGNWCRAHGVSYIGHMIEDNNQHARTGSSLGHYFRGLFGQSMAGIDDIGGQVYPGGEDARRKNIFGIESDGEFYHYALGKLASSMAEITPHMAGNSMCEIFGNYGWSEGVRLEKYLTDHFLVRGINHFVPHAFTCKAYPDPDCPPHFYAWGNNPQYRHFGRLMEYMERMCQLLEGGKTDARVGILYHGEAEWSGECMLMQKPARLLWDMQVDFRFLPGDIFSEQEIYRTQLSHMLTVNGREHGLLVIPYAQRLPEKVLRGISALIEEGGQVRFLKGLPQGGSCGDALPDNLTQELVLAPEQLEKEAEEFRTVRLRPENNRIRAMHYLRDGEEIYVLFNEGETAWSGDLHFCHRTGEKGLMEYDPWESILYTEQIGVGPTVIEPMKSRVYLSSECLLAEAGIPFTRKEAEVLENPDCRELTSFEQSVCRALEYPSFSGGKRIDELRGYEETNAKFSGFIRYETDIFLRKGNPAYLEITDAHEGVEVFLNGESLGIQVVPMFRYELGSCAREGENHLVIEVATTLARERGKREGRAGITGKVYLYQEK